MYTRGKEETKMGRWDTPSCLWQGTDGKGLALMICTYPSNDLWYQTYHVIYYHFLTSLPRNHALEKILEFEQYSVHIGTCKEKSNTWIYNHRSREVRRHKMPVSIMQNAATMQFATLCHAMPMLCTHNIIQPSRKLATSHDTTQN